MSTPPFVLAYTFTYLLGWLSDRLRTRGPFIFFGNLLGVIGFSVLYASNSPVVGYIGCFIACSGIFPNTALIISWAGSNTQGDLKRAIVLAITSGLANVGGYGFAVDAALKLIPVA
jgi:MFS family permease